MARRRGTPESVREPDLSLPALRPADRADLEGSAEHDGLEFTGVQLEEYAGGNHRFVECRLVDCRFGAVRLRRSRFTTGRWERFLANSFDIAESEWSDVELASGRIGALLAPGAKLSRVALRDLRIDYLNLRGADVNDLRLRDCKITELDLGGSRIRRADLAGSEIDRLLLPDAQLADVDLRQADLGIVEAVGQLSGAVITDHQLSRLAPALADHLGIFVR